MRRTTKLIPPSCLGQQGFRGALQRLSMTLMLVMLTTATAWAQSFTLKATGGTKGANDKEGYEKLFDGIKKNTVVEGEVVANKWCVDNIGGEDGPTYPIWVEFYSNVPIIPTQYVLTTGNDNSTENGRNPRDWKLYGKATNEGDWTDEDIIASKTDDGTMEDKDYTDYTFDITKEGTYRYFRFEVSAVRNGNVFQLSEFAFVATVNVDAKDLTYASITNLQKTYVYTGSAITLSNYKVLDYIGNEVSSDYYDVVVKNSSNETVQQIIDPGTYKLVVTGKSEYGYSGSTEATFEVVLWNGDGGYCGDETVNGSKNVYYEITEAEGKKTMTVKTNPTVAAGSDFSIAKNFRGTYAVDYVVISNGVTAIGIDAFSNSTIVSVTIPASVTSIGEGAFDGNINLTTIEVDSNNANYTTDGGVLFNKAKTTLMLYPKGNASTSYDIPVSVTTVGAKAFKQCTRLQRVTIPAGVTAIGYEGFKACSGLTELTIGSGVQTIGHEAFRDCGGLLRVTIPASMTFIEKDVFHGCTNVTDVFCYADPEALTWNEDGCDDFKRDGDALTLCHVFDAGAWSTKFSDVVNVTFTDNLVIGIANTGDNTSIISDFNGRTVNVKLDGRTLTKDGHWNTLCLPFSLTAEQIAASGLAGATIKEMDCSATGTELNNGTLTLKFTAATSIEAGKPYIVRWGTPESPVGGTIDNPVFSGVTISSTTPTPITSSDGKVMFVGQYSPFKIGNVNDGDDGNLNEIIMLGANNTLGYSKNPRTLNCFRAHFYVKADGSTQQTARRFVMDFGDDEATGVVPIDNGQWIMDNEADAWYSLDGRRLSGKPTQKGLYIHNGNKVAIK